MNGVPVSGTKRPRETTVASVNAATDGDAVAAAQAALQAPLKLILDTLSKDALIDIIVSKSKLPAHEVLRIAAEATAPGGHNPVERATANGAATAAAMVTPATTAVPAVTPPRAVRDTFIYVLRLEGGKYYIGKSDDPKRRFEEHRTGAPGMGSAWTRRYKPLELMRTEKSSGVFDEDQCVKRYMRQYGIDNVRGGSYVYEDLPGAQRETLQRELQTADDRCFRCGGIGHMVNDCIGVVDAAAEPVMAEARAQAPPAVHARGGGVRPRPAHTSRRAEEGKCYRCGRAGHYAPECYAKKHVDGYYIEDSDSSDDDY